jgi:hypothetical protein
MRRLALVSVAIVVAAGCGGGNDVPPLAAGRFLASSQSITPRVQLFAEPVLARVDVIVDRERFDPERIRVAGKFAPYEPEGAVVRTRSDDGRFTHLRFDIKLRCLTYACLPEVGGGPPEVLPGGIPPPVESQGGGFGERKSVDLEPARVVYDDPKGKPRTLRNVHWPTVQSVSRLNFGDTDVTGIGFPFEASVSPFPELSYRVAPTALGAGLLLGALALLLLPLVLFVRALRREDPVDEEGPPELSPLEQALALVAWARERPEQERREALEALAVELETSGTPELEAATRRLAWSARAPSKEAMDELVETVKEEARGTAV